MKLNIHSNSYGQYYFPKEIRDEYGRDLELVPNLKSRVIFPAGTPARLVLRSLKILEADLEQRVEYEKKVEASTDDLSWFVYQYSAFEALAYLLKKRPNSSNST